MHNAEWPLLMNENRKGHVEIMASFPDRGIWRNEPPGEPYHSVYNALFGKAGATKLYDGRVRNFSRPTFFSCSYRGDNSIFAMLDGDRVFLLDRDDHGSRDLVSISIEELRNACLNSNAKSRSAQDYKKWCDDHSRDKQSSRDLDSLFDHRRKHLDPLFTGSKFAPG